ncbi:helix-turn-helix domain-containing protein [Bacillus toyonensis]|uniref:Transposase n=1 Tax=Bacillus toyonensis TaxID=155322 RepID=A0A2A8H6T1_9BACI|nr:helix-turn-helix domain-containing protein [Bacillus toyonensis]PEP88493.1 transposase [Bacillus toyonensis]
MIKGPYSFEEKYKLVTAYEKRTTSYRDFCRQNNVSPKTIKRWIYLFQTYGKSGLHNSNGWKKYSKELKKAAILDYLLGEYSQLEIVRKYHISSTSVLDRWIKKYNSHRELQDSQKRIGISMAKKGRATALEERVEIVTYYLQCEKNYHQTAQTFDVSYQQVYQWVKKYKKEGKDGLIDKRGRSKTDVELTPEEKIKREMNRLKKENERLRVENVFLKKLEEIERGRLKKHS